MDSIDELDFDILDKAIMLCAQNEYVDGPSIISQLVSRKSDGQAYSVVEIGRRFQSLWNRNFLRLFGHKSDAQIRRSTIDGSGMFMVEVTAAGEDAHRRGKHAFKQEPPSSLVNHFHGNVAAGNLSTGPHAVQHIPAADLSVQQILLRLEQAASKLMSPNREAAEKLISELSGLFT